MTDLSLITASGTFVIAALCFSTWAMLRAWRGWLQLRTLEVKSKARDRAFASTPHGRSELVDLRERVSRLEAIATGVDFR